MVETRRALERGASGDVEEATSIGKRTFAVPLRDIVCDRLARLLQVFYRRKTRSLQWTFKPTVEPRNDAIEAL